ncbi:XdhC family protein [Paracoccaceae bacterium GXU_MW_L88]
MLDLRQSMKRDAPLDALAAAPGVLAVITGTEGPSYRSTGAMMAFLDDGRRVGSLSSGCIEADLALRADEVRSTGAPVAVRYGRGSAMVDLELPCGGGLDIFLVPQPDEAVLAALAAAHRARQAATLRIARSDGHVSLDAAGAEDDVTIPLPPPLRFEIFGKGPEAVHFAELARATGYHAALSSPDSETRDVASAAGVAVSPLLTPRSVPEITADPWTAIVLFFHDHDWEPPLLAAALASEAFYIGAQGSQRARDARNAALAARGVAADAIARIHAPIGLIPSARDPVTLAVSVLAEILDADRKRT